MRNEKKTAPKAVSVEVSLAILVCHTFLVSPLFLELFDFMDS